MCRNNPSVAITGLTTCERTRNSSSEGASEWVVMYFARNDLCIAYYGQQCFNSSTTSNFYTSLLENAISSLFMGKKHSRKCAR
jgi:hypothetical protein